MSEYPKIQTVYKRDPENKHKTLLEGEYSLPEFAYLADNEWVFTEKVDGTNIRLYATGDFVDIAGRTDRAHIPGDLQAELDPIAGMVWDSFDAVFGDGEIVLYGEGYGPKIQKHGGLYRDTPSFVLFDVMVNGWWLQREDVIDVGRKLKIDVVPEIGRGTLTNMVDMARSGLRSKWGDFQAEGIVARPATELRTRAGHRIITKVKAKDFPETA